MTVELTIDDKINGYKAQPKPEESPAKSDEDESLSPDEKEISKPEDKGKEEDNGEKEPKEPEESKKSEPKVKEKVQIDNVDEYGNEVAKARTYTEEEVQRMIRDRLARGSSQQQTPQQVQQAVSQGFEADPNSNESWEAQLEEFIDRRLETREQNVQRQQWERTEQIKQIEFETKFTNGMEKYQDFRDVVSVLPITDAIMTATREMKDPAAFLYAAAKTHPKEIERIASLPNAIHQATEIGRLEEKMRKAKNISNASRPLSPSKSDFSSEKVVPKHSIDDLIVKHAKSRRK